jgi:alkanesulfonate monooxygenase SsuD/methylene tetrahydromethanopterin reductase-like flavin-dependent oxidoreductase (luciferase family)
VADDLKVMVDLPVTLSNESGHAEARRDLAEEMTGHPLGNGSAHFAGRPHDLARFLIDWVESEACDGFTLIPTSLPLDLRLVVDQVIPELQQAGHYPTTYSKNTPHIKAPRAVPAPRPKATVPAGLAPELMWD